MIYSFFVLTKKVKRDIIIYRKRQDFKQSCQRIRFRITATLAEGGYSAFIANVIKNTIVRNKILNMYFIITTTSFRSMAKPPVLTPLRNPARSENPTIILYTNIQNNSRYIYQFLTERLRKVYEQKSYLPNCKISGRSGAD